MSFLLFLSRQQESVTCWGLLLDSCYVIPGNTPISYPHAASWEGSGVEGRLLQEGLGREIRRMFGCCTFCTAIRAARGHENPLMLHFIEAGGHGESWPIVDLVISAYWMDLWNLLWFGVDFK